PRRRLALVYPDQLRPQTRPLPQRKPRRDRAGGIILHDQDMKSNAHRLQPPSVDPPRRRRDPCYTMFGPVSVPPPPHDNTPAIRETVPHDGYRGIWFTLGFKFEYGDKYSGGLGTYTANHQPM